MIDIEEIQRVRMPKENEVFGIVESKLGGNRMRVRCQDGKTRIGRVPGRLKRRMWINPGNIVILQPWEIQGDERGDILWRYSKAQEEWLRKNNVLKL